MDTDGLERIIVSLGMFIIDDFQFHDDDDQPTGKILPPQESSCLLAAEVVLLPAEAVGMIVDRGNDFPGSIQKQLDALGHHAWLFRDNNERVTTRALNSYKGDRRGFQYTTPRIRLTPRDLIGSDFQRPKMLHFICSPTRAATIVSEIKDEDGWNPITIYEPIPDRCIPEELPALINVLPSISVLSPNAEEALSLLSIPGPPTKTLVEEACGRLLQLGVGPQGEGVVVIRSGALGAFVASKGREGTWVPAFWNGDEDLKHVVDVTGAGNGFLGGMAAGLHITGGDTYEATLYGTISSSFIIEQEGLPHLTQRSDTIGHLGEYWNGDLPHRRLKVLQDRLQKVT
ncbi:uncharacterized protein FIBRA_05533 [Fibroporia radiculosa]|uniref:Carbohydrate kinase PfkB domain-containing protein n=1 Tax=Fibroporia radiculosa TaxID=599839 RepID=J4HXQ0_9APHY|nr:uncharacterized protein FIBRA_05533 [Fibroporia radiculosa]CCM03402.1 predicted protein [Fibroporia radiculosa]